MFCPLCQGSARRFGKTSMVIVGNPNDERVSTSHAECQNLSIRMGMRRMTRLTNSHYKKWVNHNAAFAHWFCHIPN